MRQLTINKSITHRECDSLERYLSEIGKEDLLSVDEEVEIVRQIKKGNKKALEKLTKANLRFVVSVAKQYQNNGISLSDLINEGNIGLLKAAERFDDTRGFKFITYAVWWIRQSILLAIAEHSRLIRRPLNQVGIVYKINKAIYKFEQENGEWFFVLDTENDTKMAMQEALDADRELLKPEHRGYPAKFLIFYSDITDADDFELAKQCPYLHCVFSEEELI